jgi:hypothetical protein
MGVDYSIYIRTEKPLSEVKSCLEKILNCSLEQSPYSDSEHYYTILLGLGVGLIGPKREDDFFFEELHYDYLILLDYLTPSFYGYYKGEWEPSFLIIIADLLYKNLACECIVERNSDTILAKFAPSENDGE